MMCSPTERKAGGGRTRAGDKAKNTKKQRDIHGKRNLEVRILIAFNVVIHIVLDIIDFVDAEVVIVEQPQHKLEARNVIIVPFSVPVQLLLTLTLRPFLVLLLF